MAPLALKQPLSRALRSVVLPLWTAVALAAFCGWLACAPARPPATTQLLTGETESRLILVSLDGFRWDFDLRTETPNLDRLADEGVRAEILLPVFPTKTFPNHYTQVTGLWPSHHGIVGNNIRDPELEDRFSLRSRQAVADARWWGGEPIWVTAEKQGLKTAPLFWPGSEAPIGGVRPTYWQPYRYDMPNAERVDQLLAWLDLPAGDRPHFLTLYASDLDSAAHGSNPDSSPEVAEAVARVDAMLGRLLDGLAERGLSESIDLIVVSDHGMSATSSDRVIPVDDYVDLDTVDVMSMGALLTLWPKPEDVDAVYAALKGAHPHLAVYSRDEIPERFHFRDNPCIPPIVGIPDDGWSASTRSRLHESPERFDGGAHGYDHDLESMGAFFVARGPAFRQGVVVAPFRNIHLYNLMCHILGLEPAENDGDIEVVQQMLRQTAR